MCFHLGMKHFSRVLLLNRAICFHNIVLTTAEVIGMFLCETKLTEVVLVMRCHQFGTSPTKQLAWESTSNTGQ